MQIGQLEFQIDDSIMTQRKLKLRVGIHDVQLAMDRIARKLREEESVPGFRKRSAPMAKVRMHFKKRIAVQAFDELRRDATNQVLRMLDEKDQPFLRPEVLERDKVKLSYNRPLEFTVKYMVDPSGIGKNPENPMPQQGQAVPGSQIIGGTNGPMGIPSGPKLPQLPDASPASVAIPDQHSSQ